MKTARCQLLQTSYLLESVRGAAVEPNRNGLLCIALYVERSCIFGIDVEIKKLEMISHNQLWNIQM